MDGKSPVCYYRDSIMNYLNPEAAVTLKSFDPDLAVGQVKDDTKAGLFTFKLYFHDASLGPFDP